MERPLHIVCFIATLGAGGAERVMTILANGLVGRGMRFTIVTLSETGNDFYRVDPLIERSGLGVLGPSTNWIVAIKNMRRRVVAIKGELVRLQPDVAVTFVDQTNILVLLAARGLNVPVIASERVDPTQYRIPKVYEFLRKWLYPKAAALVIQTQSVIPWAKGIVDESMIHVIPNPVAPPVVAESDHSTFEQTSAFQRPFIAAAGRLEPQKGFDLLIAGFARISSRFPQLNLVIAGDGSQKENLRILANSAGLGDRVFFPGRIQNPFQALRFGEMFVLSSRFEGFPNVLIEAMAHGLPVISFDCRSGPADAIRNGIDGLLIPPENIDELANAMERLMEDDSLRESLGQRAKEVVDRFSENRIVGDWDSLLRHVSEK